MKMDIILELPLQLMKATVQAESSSILSIFIVICLLQLCLWIVARYVLLSFLLFNIFLIIFPIFCVIHTWYFPIPRGFLSTWFVYMLLTYFMAQQPLKSFDHTLMRGSLSNSILVTLIFYQRQSQLDRNLSDKKEKKRLRDFNVRNFKTE